MTNSPLTSTRRTDDEVLAELKSESTLNIARRRMGYWLNQIERAWQKDPIEARRLELEAVEDIAKTMNGP